MESRRNGTARAPWREYVECDWGDVIYGSKEQLQALGLGVGRAYPGELGGPRHELRVRDPRGWPVNISDRYQKEDVYCARVPFPNLPESLNMPVWQPVAHGVKLCKQPWADDYRGSADDLAAAGLLRLDQLPGAPGMRKTRVTILPDGSVPTGAPTANHSAAKAPGARQIERAAASTFIVSVRVTKEEVDLRRAARVAADEAWGRQVRALPRPARLQPMALAKWTGIEGGNLSAARDVRFQCMLARIVSDGAAPRRGGA